MDLIRQLEGHMYAAACVNILDNYLTATFDLFRLRSEEINFEQDNDPKYTPGLADTWFEDNRIELLKWPPQSGRLNLLENLWHHLKM